MAFNTLPRVETAETIAWVKVGKDWQAPFNTLPRVETAETQWRLSLKRASLNLSIPYHGSRLLRRQALQHAAILTPQTFNTLPRVETAETPDPLRQRVGCRRFQYPTTGRDC